MTHQTISAKAVKLTLKLYAGQLKRTARFSIPALLLPGIATTLTFYVPPLVIAKVINSYTAHNGHLPYQQLMGYAAWFVGFSLLGELCWRVAIHCIIRTQVRSIESLYNFALEKLLQKDIGFFQSNFAGAITKHATAFARNFEYVTNKLAHDIIPVFINLAFISIVLWTYSPWLVLCLCSVMITVACIAVVVIKRRAPLIVALNAVATRLTGVLADIIGNAHAVKAFGREKAERHNYSLLAADYAKKATKAWNYYNLRYEASLGPVLVLVNAIGLVLAVQLAASGNAGAGFVVIVFSYLSRFTSVLWDLNPLYREIESFVSDAAEFSEYLLQPPTIVDIDNPKPFKVQRGEVEFKHIHFDYHGQGQTTNGDPLFQNFSLRVAAGERIGLVGPSGGGKTTISKLLLRFMDINGGKILIDGQNIALARQADVRQHIAYVPQEPVMFHRSLMDNIRYGRPDASGQEAHKVAQLAHAAEFIDKLPQGYQTLVGERGLKLSGGQRQRIAIARAIIKNAPILVLDEATSALDSESEKLIQAALEELMQGRTCIVIAHRLSTIHHLDRIVVLDDGRIIEEGSHKVLLAKNGLYAQLWKHQSGGFIDE